LRTAVSGRVNGAALLIIGLVVGTGLGYAAFSLNGGTKITTATETTTVTLLGTNTVTTGFGPFTGYAQISTTVTSCVQVTIRNGTQKDEQCSLVLTNTGNLGVADPTTCTMTFNGLTHNGQFTKDSGSLAPNSSEQGTCTNTDDAVAASGDQIAGNIPLSDGGIVVFEATAS